MTASKIALSIPAEVLKQAKKQVRAGRAKSLSAFVSEAVDEKLRRDELTELLDALDAERGAPNKSARAWAKRVLAPSS
jgi:Arc/MetJ-type ribon-helix-helix transcriptional regulator